MIQKSDQELFRKHFIENKKYAEIAHDLKIDFPAIRKKYNEFKQRYTKELAEIKRLRRIFSTKKCKFKQEFKFKDFPCFYDWLEKQGDKCFYCETEQFKITKLVTEGKNGNPKGIYSSQIKNRGRNLEIERKNSQTNEYSKDNCALICYFCNNDKSNVISGDDYIEYFKNTGALKHRQSYINQKYKSLTEN